MTPYRRLRLFLALREVWHAIGQGLLGVLLGALLGWLLAEAVFPRG